MLRQFLRVTLFPLLLSSCQLAQQWQEARRLDEAYAQYLEGEKKESPSLVNLKKAAQEATRAQIHIIHSFSNKAGTTIPLSDEELAIVRDIVTRLQNKPAYNRKAWEKFERFRQEIYMTVSYHHFTNLEFLNEKGECLDELPLTPPIGSCHNAAAYAAEFAPYTSLYMLPENDRERFYKLPSVKKAEKI